jgi:ergothioneine biosynthesis protein EgtB
VLGGLASGDPNALEVALLGTHHEEQHQELLLTDVKHALAQNPLRPAYSTRGGASDARDGTRGMRGAGRPLEWFDYGEKVALVGHEAPGFSFDNEGPRHRVLVLPFRLASRLVTNAEYAAFVADGGYARPELWLSDGWAMARAEGWRAPLYWEGVREEGGRKEGGNDGAREAFTFHGIEALDPSAPVTHVSFYEADAYARWSGHRLPTEFEWELAATGLPVEGNFLERGCLAPAIAGQPASGGPAQLFGDAWEWTASAYLPYPKFRVAAGALGEYNGKFMSGQMVLRGGSCLSPAEHLRPTYRNFFPPHVRWQMAGIRLASDGAA